jgi:hypothetical protein
MRYAYPLLPGNPKLRVDKLAMSGVERRGASTPLP